MRIRTIALFIFLFIAAAFFVSGCSGSSGGKVHIVIWHQMRPDEREILKAQCDRFMKLHPEVLVENIYKETEELRSGYIIAAYAQQGPDLVYGPSDAVGLYSALWVVQPLERLFDLTYLASFNPRGLVWSNGHLYQIADKLGNHLTLVYNRKLVPVPPETSDEMIALGEKIRRRNERQYGLCWNFTEPFFFIPFLTGFGGWVMDSAGTPTLDAPAMVNALKFIQDLRDKYRIIPKESNYEVADALFKEGRSGMIINGDWSWEGYEKAGIDLGVAPLPKISQTGLWCAPMISTKGYSINTKVDAKKLPYVVELLRFLMEPSIQLETTKALLTFPTRKVLYTDPFIVHNEIMRNSMREIEIGRPMPIVPELRAIWDAMRPNYQSVLNGSKTPEQASHDMQLLALQKIAEMNE
ncbi:MAG: hypothetical protein COS95_05530 [Ignavibacteriales bacterium CG07_land_8_20_14_0_80_59_12]|nr:MAG: hypothetical protein COS95_05530 [Ignavibacteriales bacterium CG07_land_8_20_14_0_80_59_12]